MNDEGKALALLEQHMEHDKEQFASINAKLDKLIEAHNKQRGFIAGFSAACSLLITTIVGLIVYIWRQATGQ